jgi:trk system potassium uptake protein
MDIVIVGAGEVGYHLADILSREEHRVSVLDSDEEKAGRLMEALDVQALVGDGTRVEVLTRAGASKADLVVAVTQDDRSNMLACLLAKKLGAKRAILRLKDMTRMEEYRYFYKQAIGFDVVLSTDELAAEEIVGTVRQHRALEVESFAGGRVQLRRLRIREEGELTSDSLAGLNLPKGLLIVAVSRKEPVSNKEHFFVPSGNDRLAVDDQVYLIGRGPDLDQFELLAGAPKIGRRSVVIMGGGGVGVQIARKLDAMRGISVRLIERSAARAKAIVSNFSSAVMVLVGDSTDLDLLTEERIGEANVFIATTADDERNMVACQLARSLGVERTVAMVNKSSYRQIYDLLGVDRAVSPRVLCANHILRFVRSRSVSSIAVIADGRAEVLEIEAHHRDGKTERKVKNLGLPRGTVLGAVVRENDVVIPSGDTVVRNGDHVIVFTLPENLGSIEEVFGNPDAYQAD